jgi:hypothetical protein
MSGIPLENPIVGKGDDLIFLWVAKDRRVD